jgi:hypothetical protein
MRVAVILAGVVATAVSPASAENLLTTKGQPVCETIQDLFAYVRAFSRSERDAYTCRFMKVDLRMEVEKSIPHPEMPGVEVAMVRVYGSTGKKSVDGFTLIVRK